MVTNNWNQVVIYKKNAKHVVANVSEREVVSKKAREPATCG